MTFYDNDNINQYHYNLISTMIMITLISQIKYKDRIMNKGLNYNQNLITESGIKYQIVIWSIQEWKRCIFTAKAPLPFQVYGLKRI